MKSEKIKKKRKKVLKKLDVYQNKLEKLQEQCEHKNTKESLVMWRAGSTFTGMVCDDCGKVTENLDMNSQMEFTFSTSEDKPKKIVLAEDSTPMVKNQKFDLKRPKPNPPATHYRGDK